MIYREDFFATTIWCGFLNFDTEKIKNLCLKEKEFDTLGKSCSNLGGWQSKDNINTKKEFQDFFGVLETELEHIYRDISPSFKTIINNAWININGPYDYNRRHTHPWSTLSGCIYINVDDDSGEILFHNPTNQKFFPFHIENTDKRYAPIVSYKPENNKIIIFPSWIEHEVLSSKNSKNDRISLSFNLTQIN